MKGMNHRNRVEEEKKNSKHFVVHYRKRTENNNVG